MVGKTECSNATDALFMMRLGWVVDIKCQPIDLVNVGMNATKKLVGILYGQTSDTHVYQYIINEEVEFVHGNNTFTCGAPIYVDKVVKNDQ